MFWLSHHRPHELHRCYRLGAVHVCARCLGTYPVMFAAIGAQLAFKAPLEHALDVPLSIALVLPATLDWAAGRLQPHRFKNLWRTTTGVLLGLGLARSLFIHLQRPLPLALLGQGIVVTVIALPVIFAAYRQNRRW